MLALSLVCLLAPQGPNAPVTINEFVYDDTSLDEREFVELFNATNAAIDISNWVLEASDPAGATDNNADYTIPASTSLAAGGFWVIGSSNVPNVNQVVGVSDLWENSNESLTLRDSGGTVIDTLVYEANKGVWAGALIEGEGIWGNKISNDGRATSWSRMRDGYDTGNNGRDFRMVPETPGTSNNLSTVFPYTDTFDGTAVGTALTADWGSSFQDVFVIDPTVADTHNPNAIPASPVGGNAAVFWDEVGGGNYNMLRRDAVEEIEFEAYVYFDAALELAGFRETWTLGIQGTSATFYNSPDPSGSFGFAANGNTGVCWTFEVTENAATLYLTDRNDGGMGANAVTPLRVLGQIALTAGVNDGWQRLQLRAGKDFAVGRFGGTFGQNDGTTISGAIDNGSAGGVYVGYRELVGDNLTTRPFTADLILVREHTARASLYGAAVPSSTGTPTIGVNSYPTLGNAGFAITLRDMRPSQAVAVFIGFTQQNIDLTPLGAQPGSRLLCSTEVDTSVVVDAQGAFDFNLPVPQNAALNGAPLFSQSFELDVNLNFPLPIAHTGGLALILGN